MKIIMFISTLILILFTDLSAQHLFPEKFDKCGVPMFMLEGDSIMTAYNEENLFHEIIYNIDPETLEKTKGEILLQVIIDTEGNACCLSALNKSNTTIKNLNIPEIISTQTK